MSIKLKTTDGELTNAEQYFNADPIIRSTYTFSPDWVRNLLDDRATLEEALTDATLTIANQDQCLRLLRETNQAYSRCIDSLRAERDGLLAHRAIDQGALQNARDDADAQRMLAENYMDAFASKPDQQLADGLEEHIAELRAERDMLIEAVKLCQSVSQGLHATCKELAAEVNQLRDQARYTSILTAELTLAKQATADARHELRSADDAGPH